LFSGSGPVGPKPGFAYETIREIELLPNDFFIKTKFRTAFIKVAARKTELTGSLMKDGGQASGRIFASFINVIIADRHFFMRRNWKK
jgi:hypothetical protein